MFENLFQFEKDLQCLSVVPVHSVRDTCISLVMTENVVRQFKQFILASVIRVGVQRQAQLVTEYEYDFVVLF